MNVYFLHKGYDIDKFKEICKSVEKLYPNFNKQPLLTDVDDSLIQVYSHNNLEIVITNSAELDLIKAVTNVDLSEFKYTEAILENNKLILIKQ